MSSPLDVPFVVVVGSGGVGKTTVAAALGLKAARAGHRTLVMTFDPSHRLKDALGVGEEAREREVAVPTESIGEELPGELAASLLDARRTFDRLVARHAPDAAARDRILGNRFYDHLSGGLAGILEYMAVERLFEVAAAGSYERVVLDTPPTRQALDFLEAPQRIISFLDSGVLKVALRPWFDAAGRFRPTAGWGRVGRRVEGYLDDLVGLDLLRDMAEFFQAFAPLYAGFRERAAEVQALLRAPETRFVLVAAPQEERIPDTLFFARRLADGGYRLGPLVVNRIHPQVEGPPAGDPVRAIEGRDGRSLLAWLGRRDHRGAEELGRLLGPCHPLVRLPLLPEEPTDLASLTALGRRLEASLATAGGGGPADSEGRRAGPPARSKTGR